MKPSTIFTCFISVLVASVTMFFVQMHILTGDMPKRRVEKANISSRARIVRQVCNKFNYGKQYDVDTFKNIIVNDKYRIMFCYVPKVACTNFLRLFLWLNESNENDMSFFLQLNPASVHVLKKNISSLRAYSSSEIRYRLKYYTKALFVRNPLVRLISAFRNKFVTTTNPYFVSRYGKKIVQRSKSNKTPAIGSITFLEFLRYLTDERTIKEGYQEHWMLFNDLCHPCFIDYNFIGTYETFDQDVNTLLELLNIQDKFIFPGRDKRYKHARSEELLSSTLSDVDQDTFNSLINIYAYDFSLFNYTIPSLSDIKLKSRDIH
ncbi:carbohydrate sulfotransferase 11-like [Ruditapes philippinarum]|uniref:carbohydrate sulfotransferase 11-like n=1 Tax=Ruditapes philippinarum TaxID=129788 RepID=UPI00295B2FC2|nr:carbohydrate sulfotransferase 11-like [Ruditapes philippinarum]